METLPSAWGWLGKPGTRPVRRVFYFFEHVSRICDERLTVTVPPGLCFICVYACTWSTWSAVINPTPRAGELRSAPSWPDDRYRVAG